MAKTFRSRKVGNRFQNLDPDFVSPSEWQRMRFIASRIWTTTVYPQNSPLSPVEPDVAALRANRTDSTATWIGHATFFIQQGGLNILTDPQWSARASPVSFAGPKRMVPPGIRFEDLPPIDAVLISHDHYDHLDLPTVRRLAARDKPRFLVPLGLKTWFEQRGIANVEELDWWDTYKLRDCVLTCVPAQHFSGRTLTDRNSRLWSGWSVQGSRGQFFFAGDTGYYPALFKEIRRRLGEIELAAIPIGAYLPAYMMQCVHSTPEQALQIFTDIGAARFTAMHWGTFDLADEPIGEPPIRLEAERQRLGLEKDRVWVLRPGETRPW